MTESITLPLLSHNHDLNYQITPTFCSSEKIIRQTPLENPTASSSWSSYILRHPHKHPIHKSSSTPNLFCFPSPIALQRHTGLVFHLTLCQLLSTLPLLLNSLFLNPLSPSHSGLSLLSEWILYFSLNYGLFYNLLDMFFPMFKKLTFLIQHTGRMLWQWVWNWLWGVNAHYL